MSLIGVTGLISYIFLRCINLRIHILFTQIEGAIMKVKEFLRLFEYLNYDDDTELLVLLTSADHLTKFVQIEDVCNNDDCMNYNEIGIVLRD